MISPLLIVFRVALGSGWSKRIADRIATSEIHVRNLSTGISASRSHPDEYPLGSMNTATIGYDRKKGSVGHAPMFIRTETNQKYSV